MKKTLLGFGAGLLAGFILLPLGVYLYFQQGYAPVATAAPPWPFEKRLASAALRARIAREAPGQCPIEATEDNLVAGAKIYREQCAVCHGLSGQPKTPIAQGMFPRPPQLFKGKGVTDDPVGETYWKTANGIRLTGMPAFRDSLSESQLWQVSQLLLNATNLPPAAIKALAAGPPAK
jgi:mono/diheme cytochrome c family protein